MWNSKNPVQITYLWIGPKIHVSKISTSQRDSANEFVISHLLENAKELTGLSDIAKMSAQSEHRTIFSIILGHLY